MWTRCGCRAGKSCSSPRPSPMSRGAHDGKGMPRRRDRRVPVRAFRAADRPEAARARAVLHHRCPDGHGVPGSGNEPGEGHRHSRRQPARHGQGRCRRPQAAGLPALPRRHRRGRARPASGRRRNRAHRRCRIYVHRPARRDVHRSRAPRILRLAAARRLGAPGRPRRQRQSAPPRHHRNGTHPRHSARQIPIRPPLIAPPPGNPAGSHGEGRVGLTV